MVTSGGKKTTINIRPTKFWNFRHDNETFTRRRKQIFCSASDGSRGLVQVVWGVGDLETVRGEGEGARPAATRAPWPKLSPRKFGRVTGDVSPVLGSHGRMAAETSAAAFCARLWATAALAPRARTLPTGRAPTRFSFSFPRR